jgi:SAM-dependent methyltransferase
MRVLAAFDIVRDCGGDRFELTAVGATLCADAPKSVRPLVMMFGNEHSWETFELLGDCIRTGQNAFEIRYGLESSFAYLDGRPDLAAIFNAGMSVVSASTGPALAQAYDFRDVSHVIDVGGGEGKILFALLDVYPRMHGTLFELPRVIAHAATMPQAASYGTRFAVVGGDMFACVPADADVYLLSHVIHDWDDDRSIAILRSCRRAMRPDARLLILDRVMPDVVEPTPVMQGNVLLDLTMLVRTGGGRERTHTEFNRILQVAGFDLLRTIELSTIPDSLLEAKPIAA